MVLIPAYELVQDGVQKYRMVSMPLKVFVVFHETLDPGCYETLDPEEFELITFLAVNPAIPKTYYAERFTRVINEWELPEYDGTLQEMGYCENSAMFHAHKNGLYEPGDIVLFLQWDMVLEKGCIRAVAAAAEKRPVFCVQVAFSKFEVFFPPGIPMDLLIDACDSFQVAFQRPFGTEAVFPLNNAFAVPGRDLSAVLEWAFSLRERVEKACENSEDWEHVGENVWKRIGIVFEHLTALAFGNLYDKNIWLHLPGVWHPTSHAASQTPQRVLDAVGTDIGCRFK